MKENYENDEMLEDVYFREEDEIVEDSVEENTQEEIKELDLGMIEEANKSFTNKRKIFVKINNEAIEKEQFATLEIDEVFSTLKVKTCVKEFIEKIDYLRIYYREDDIHAFMQVWMIMLIIKHFSSLEIPNDFKKQLAVLEQLINTEILYQVFAEYSQGQILKINKELQLVLQFANENLDKYGDLIQEMDLKASKLKYKVGKEEDELVEK